MDIKSTCLTIFLLTLAFTGLAAHAEPRSSTSLPAITTVCELKNEAGQRRRMSRTVTITDSAYYDFEHGYYLASVDCQDSVDGTGVIRVDFPVGKTVEDFPELLKLSSQTWLSGNIGKKPRCTCVGKARFADGDVTFTLIEAKAVWASDD